MPLVERLRARAGRLLEEGLRPTALRRAAASLWEIAAAGSVRRPLHAPAGLRVIGIGGAVLGGAGKTPVAVAVARELAARGEAVALVSHAYRASPGMARRVHPFGDGDGHGDFNDPRDVGDDALASARLLAPYKVPVIVGPSRQAALDFARASGASIAVVDGLLQAAPAPLTDSVLVLDALAPWGSQRCPPLGDLRAPREALLSAADHIAVVTPAPRPALADLPPNAPRNPAREAALPQGSLRLPSSLAGALDASGQPVDLASLRKPLRAGLILAIAHPERVLAALAGHEIEPALVLALADHAALTPADLNAARARAARAPRRPNDPKPPDIWLTTARCATKLPPELWGAPVLALDHRVEVGPLLARLRAITAPSSRTPPPVC